jgi:mannonate dehydratase
MRLATVLTPLSDENLQLAAQCGVSDVVARYPGPRLDDLQHLQSRVESFGLQLAVIEGGLPLENIKLGCDDGSELGALQRLIGHMGEAGVPLLCYNFMAGTDWVRTKLDVRERGGALVTAFNRADVPHAVSLDGTSGTIAGGSIDAETLWGNLERLLHAIVPVAEKAGVTLAIHPDDPPLPELCGKARIMNSVASFERLVQLVPSERNAICFCQGTFAEMGVEIPPTIRRLGPYIKYVHFRDVRGTADDFVETFHDNGPTDMAAAIRAYREIGFEGPLRPDHVPQLVGEEDGKPGYTMRGRLFAYGYIRGLIQATELPQCGPKSALRKTGRGA